MGSILVCEYHVAFDYCAISMSYKHVIYTALTNTFNSELALCLFNNAFDLIKKQITR